MESNNIRCPGMVNANYKQIKLKQGALFYKVKEDFTKEKYDKKEKHDH
jgi:hypothetical protein